MLRKALLVLVLVGMLFAALGCHTVQGVGEDISSLGHAMSEAASH